MNAQNVFAVPVLAALLSSAALGQGIAPRASLPPPVAPATTARVPVNAAPLERADLEAWLDGFMPVALAQSDTAGGVVVVVKNGQVLLQKGYGHSDVARRTPVSPETTLFRPASVSKLFTATAVLQLVERGKLDLDQDVNVYLDFKIPPYQGKPITLRHLLTHTAGFEESYRYLIGNDPAGTLPLDQLVKQTLPTRVFAPGTTPAYSNYGFALAGYIVGRVSGQSFDDYMDQHVLRPIGMTRSSFRQPLPEALRPLMSKGYKVASGDPRPFEMLGPAPAGSLTASGADMGRFMIAHLEKGRGLLRPETARMMHDTTLTFLPPLNRMALGFYEQNIHGRRVLAHGGDLDLFHSDLALFIDDGVGLFVSLNSAGTLGDQLPLRTALFTGFADRYFPARREETRVGTDDARKHARMMAGSYSASRGARTNFFNVLDLIMQPKLSVNADGSLSAPALTGIGQQPRRWVETSPFVWREVGGSERIAAQVVDGQVTRWSFDLASAIMVFDRVPWYRDSTWLLPAFLVSLVAILLTALAWPTGVIARRAVKAPRLSSGGTSLRIYRLTQGLAWLAVVTLGLYAAFFGLALRNSSLIGGPLDGLLWTAQIMSPIAFLGLCGLAALSMVRVWAGGQGWFSKTWSVLLLLAALVVLWVAVAFKLLGFGTVY